MNDYSFNNDRVKIVYRHTPEHTRFQPGHSGNPDGTRKRPPSDLPEAIKIALNEPLPKLAGQRGRLTRRQLGVRNLIKKVAEGDVAAFTDLVRLREEAGPSLMPKVTKISFDEALNRKGWRKLTDTFFKEQDQEKATRRRQLKERGLPMADLIDQELARRVIAKRADKPVRVSMLQVIANRYANETAEGNGKVIRFLQKLIPEEKTLRRTVVTEVEKPTGEQRARMIEMQKEEEREIQDILKGPTMGEILAARRRGETDES